MNTLIKCMFIGIVAAMVGYGCDGGQIQFGGTDGTGPPGGGAGPSGVPISVSDTAGTSIENGEIDPTVAIVIEFPEPITSRFQDMAVSVHCDGVSQNLDVALVSETSFSVNPASGRWPQMEHCVLRLLTEGYYETSFMTRCGVWDNFDNPLTMDRSAASYEYGEGCWRANLADPYYSWDDYDMVAGQLVVDVFDKEDGPDGVPAYWAVLSKAINGENYEMILAVEDFTYTLRGDHPVEDASYRFVVTDWDALLSGGDPARLVITYSARQESGHPASYTCVAQMSSSTPVDESCGDGTVAPYLGFAKQGSLYTPWYSLDGGATRGYFHDTSEARIMYDIDGLSGEVDIVIVSTASYSGLTELFVDAVEMIGDAVVVR